MFRCTWADGSLVGDIQTLILGERGVPHAAESANGPARASIPLALMWERIFSIGSEPVMKVTIFISPPQRRQASVTLNTIAVGYQPVIRKALRSGLPLNRDAQVTQFRAWTYSRLVKNLIRGNVAQPGCLPLAKTADFS